MCPYLYDLAHVNPESAKICVQEIIREKHDEFEKNKRKYPDMDTVCMKLYTECSYKYSFFFFLITNVQKTLQICVYKKYSKH